MHMYGCDPFLSFSDIPERKIAGFVFGIRTISYFPSRDSLSETVTYDADPHFTYSVLGMKIYVTGCPINLLLRVLWNYHTLDVWTLVCRFFVPMRLKGSTTITQTILDGRDEVLFRIFSYKLSFSDVFFCG